MTFPAEVLEEFHSRNSDLLTFELDVHGVICDCSPAVSDLLEVDCPVGDRLADWLETNSRDTLSAMLRGAAETGWLVFRRENGAMETFKGAVVSRADRHYLFAVRRDSSAAKFNQLAAANRELTSLTRRLRSRNRRLTNLGQELSKSNQELSVFADVVAHDLIEPLTTLSGYTQLLARLEEGAASPDRRECMDQIVAGAKRMRLLIRDLLDFSRVHRHEDRLAPVDCRRLLAGVIDDLRHLVRRRDAWVCCGELPVVVADRAMLARVLQNLLANAIQHCPDRPPRIHVSAERYEGGWLFRVVDNGPGITDDEAERIFELFYRGGRNAGEGSGVGLAICHKIVTRHGGRIWCERDPDGGARFCFTLPIRQASHGRDAAEQPWPMQAGRTA